jgi:uncharacterized Zn finger protein
VAKRRANAAPYAARPAKSEGRELSPVAVDGRKIATTFWGQAWREHLESFGDFANRLPRWRTDVCDGSVIDLQIANGEVTASVSGSDACRLKIGIKPLRTALWRRIKQDCACSIVSLVDLLQGRFDRGVMERLTHQTHGLFPPPNEIAVQCSCPACATMCKHAVAVLYAVGARLDREPELLFTLRNVDHLELIDQAATQDSALGGEQAGSLAGNALGERFGLEFDVGSQPASGRAPRGRRVRGTSRPERTVAAGRAPRGRTKAGAARASAPQAQDAADAVQPAKAEKRPKARTSAAAVRSATAAQSKEAVAVGKHPATAAKAGPSRGSQSEAGAAGAKPRRGRKTSNRLVPA